jgi:hypothetical protein
MFAMGIHLTTIIILYCHIDHPLDHDHLLRHGLSYTYAWARLKEDRGEGLPTADTRLVILLCRADHRSATRTGPCIGARPC